MCCLKVMVCAGRKSCPNVTSAQYLQLPDGDEISTLVYKLLTLSKPIDSNRPTDSRLAIHNLNALWNWLIERSMH